MTRRQVRGAIAVPVLGALGALLFWGFSGIAPFGAFHGFYGRLLVQVSVPERHATNVVGSVVFDYRGFDTLGEEFILFAAVSGIVLLLRGDESEAGADADASGDVRSDALRLFGVAIAGAGVLVGLWLVSFGLVTPGGGFQGGVAIAAALLVVYLTVGYGAWRRLANEQVADPVEGIGVGGYVAVGLAALISGLPFLHNLLGPGEVGTLLSGGSMNLLNWAVALEVAAANVTLYAQFLERYVAPVVRAGG